MKNRNETDDCITAEAGYAIKQFGIGVKCATITPDAERVKEYKLKKAVAFAERSNPLDSGWDGVPQADRGKNIIPVVIGWKKPIIIGRHAYGDLYRSVEMV